MLTPEECKAAFKRGVQELSIADNLWDLGIIYTQATLETGHFKSVLAQNYNYFGIKKSSKWYPHIDRDTTEYVKGIIVHENDPFCVFGTEYTAMAFYTMNVRRLYKYAYSNRAHYKNYFIGLEAELNMKAIIAECKDTLAPYYDWSTFPKYAIELTRLYEELRDKGEINWLYKKED